MCPWSTKAVISSTAIFVAITKNTVWVKICIFLLSQKSLDIKIMFHEDMLDCEYIKTQLLIINMHC